jgi:hypothetical protein
MSFMRGEKGAARLREWRITSRDTRTRALTRRDRVLAHDWAAKRLCLILDITRAEHWTGYVPPRLDGDGRLDTTPARSALVALLLDVASADGEALPVEDTE